MKIPEDYVERVYAGWLGKVIGVRHGSNIEGWSYEKIKATYGEITGYLYDFKNFAADDDTNGSIFLLRALADYSLKNGLTAQQFGLTQLNYAPYEHGFYWWGGYGVSTEHTAYLNLRNGITAPRSGSMEQNGTALSEQIGGQIFVDALGLAVPGDFKRAAELAQNAASVSHDGNGIYGGMFIAACVSAAFEKHDVRSIIEAGLSVIPENCEYHKMADVILAFHHDHPNSWRDCFQFIQKNYGYDRYPGRCHIIPNAAVILLALLYGGGDFSETINICCMCGWDTDCNTGNVGTIIGVLVGLDGIDMAWRKPINDLLICSSVVGSMNITDIPSCACFIAGLGYKIAGVKPPERWNNILSEKDAIFPFELPGSTHAFRLSDDTENPASCRMEQTEEAAYRGKGSLRITATPKSGSRDPLNFRVFHKTYYRPKDFDDSRYDPAFSPTLYPGQTIKTCLMLDHESDADLEACLYVFDGNNQVQLASAPQKLCAGKWTVLSFQIPSQPCACIEEAGVRIAGKSGKPIAVYLDEFSMRGQPDYEMDFSKERMEYWNEKHVEISQFTYLKGMWELEDGELSGSCCDFGETYTGSRCMEDYSIQSYLTPIIGEHHNINFRVQGSIRSYAVGLAPHQKVALYKNDNGYEVLKEINYTWKQGQKYCFKITVQGPKISVSDADGLLMEYEDSHNPYLTGQVGFSVMHGSHCHYQMLKISPVPQIGSGNRS